MAGVSVSSIRQLVATALATELSASDWRESDDPYDLFGFGGDGEGRGHLGYAVGVPLTTALNDRQPLDEGAYSDTSLRIKWAYNLSVHDQIVAYDQALDAERAILAAVMTVRRSTGLSLVFGSAIRTVDAEGWMMGEISLRALHNLPLS